MGWGPGARGWHIGVGPFGHHVSEAGQAAPRCQPARPRDVKNTPLPAPSLTGLEAPGPPPGPGRAGEGNVIPTQLTRLWRPAPGRAAAGAGLRRRGPPGQGSHPGEGRRVHTLPAPGSLARGHKVTKPLWSLPTSLLGHTLQAQFPALGQGGASMGNEAAGPPRKASGSPPGGWGGGGGGECVRIHSLGAEWRRRVPLGWSSVGGQNRQPQTLTGLSGPAFSHESALHRFQKIEILRNTRAPIAGAPERSWGPYGRGPEVPQDTGPEWLPPAPARQLRPATAAHTCSFPGLPGPRRSPAATHRILEATTRFGLRGHVGGGHNESGSPQAGPIGRRRVGGVGRDAHEEAPRRRPAGMQSPCASRLTQRAAAPALAPPGRSWVPYTLATPSPHPRHPYRPVFPTLGANRRLFPFNGPGPAPALPPAPAAHRRQICQSLPQPEPATLSTPDSGRSPAAPRPSALETEGRSWDPGRSRSPGMRVPAPTPRRGRHGRGYCPCTGMKLSRGPRRPAAASSAGP